MFLVMVILKLTGLCPGFFFFCILCDGKIPDGNTCTLLYIILNEEKLSFHNC